MLVRVLARSRPECQFVENNDGPKGLEPPRKPVLCGIEPARRRDTPVVPPPAAGAGFAPVSIPDTPGGRNGLVDGVGLEDCEIGCWGFKSVRRLPTGENREGTVPALALRDEL